MKAAPPAAAAKAIPAADAAVLVDSLEGKSERFKVNARALVLAMLGPAGSGVGEVGKPAWGTIHQAVPGHPLRDFVGAEYEGEAATGAISGAGGAVLTVAVDVHGNSFQLSNGPSFRMVLDVGNWDGSKAVNFPGQSGGRRIRIIRIWLARWGAGENFPLLYTRAAVEEATEKRIRLEPR